MRGLLKMYGKSRVYVLGAGFSARAGMPCTRDLLACISRAAASKPWVGEDGKPYEYGQARWLAEELEWYFPLHKFDVPDLLNGKVPADFDIERFMSYVSAHSAFLYKTSERWNEHGDKFLAFLKLWIAQAIYEVQGTAVSRLDGAYTPFVDSLSSAVVLTFNWDTLVEQMLALRGIEYAYTLHETFEKKAVPLIKLHGSIDWFSRPEPGEQHDWMRLTPVGDAFPTCVRATGDLINYYRRNHTPWIVVPSFDKTSQVLNLGEIWQVPWMYLQDRLDIVFIGYSMRPDDWHARGLFYPQLVAGTRSGSLRVTVVDLAETEDQKRAIRDRFVGVENCRFFFDGFSEGAMEFINASEPPA